jgi:hypothetical protein
MIDQSYERTIIQPTKDRCLRCGLGMTWAEQRRQFGRLIRKGLSPQEVKAITPLCQKCITVAFDRTNQTTHVKPYVSTIPEEPGQSSQ